MSKYVVLTDSTCDLPEEAAKQHNIDIVCFKIALDGEGYTERVDFTPEQFCEMLKKASGLPTTAQITQFEFFDKFEEYDRQGVEQTLYISINAGGSGTNAADITLKLKAGTDLSNAPFFWNNPSKTSCLNVASALPGTLKIAFRSAPAAGTVVAAGADYTLTENDLNNLISLNEGVRFALVNGQIVTAE